MRLYGPWYWSRQSACGRCFFFQAEDGIRDLTVTGVQTCALPISLGRTLCGDLLPAGGVDLGSACLAHARFVQPLRQPAGGLAARPLVPYLRRTRRRDRKSVVQGKRGDLGGRRIIKKKKKNERVDV